MKLSIVVPVLNEGISLSLVASGIEHLINVDNFLNQTISECNILFIDDGSTDNSWDVIKELKSNNFKIKVRGIKLSRNFGHQNALVAGLSYASEISDANICIDADLQHDINLIPKFIEEFKNGNEIVLGIKKTRGDEAFLKQIFSVGYYRLLKLMGVNIYFNHADFRLLSTRVTLELLKFKEKNLFIRGLIPTMGFKTTILQYDVKDRLHGESKYSAYKMISLALKGITAFSVRPLRFITLIGLLCFIFSMIMSAYVIYSFINYSIVPGWASTLLPIYFLGGLQILSIGIMGEYIGRIYIEVKSRPLYIIEEKL